MWDHLLVTLDGSEFGEHALPFAMAIASGSGASVHLAHVHAYEAPTDLLQNTPFQYEGVSMAAYEDRFKEEERAYLVGKAAEVQEELPQSKVCSALLEGYVTEAIERHAREIGAKLIVMTTHGRTGVSRAWLGSVADSLVRHSDFPLLVIRPLEAGGKEFPEARFERFLVPLDGSEVGEKILESAIPLQRAVGAKFILLHVVSPHVTIGARVSPLPSGHLDQRLQEAEAYLGGVADRLRGEGIDTETKIESHFAPARAILNTAEDEDVDLIAIATHGYTGVRRALLGSVTDKVLRAARWPLLLQRPQPTIETS
jgi:nucleotide-binding universal stress UspA family protein